MPIAVDGAAVDMNCIGPRKLRRQARFPSAGDRCRHVVAVDIPTAAAAGAAEAEPTGDPPVSAGVVNRSARCDGGGDG